VPEWWSLFDAAEKCNCKPWELLEMPLAWTSWALMKLRVEAEVERRRSRLGGRGSKAGAVHKGRGSRAGNGPRR
jgi:hypothetical protein